MIVGERKPLASIVEMLEGCTKVLVVGCGTCVTVCMAGGEKEVGVLASALRLEAKSNGVPLTVDEVTIERQCEWEFVEELKDKIDRYDAVLSMGCGAGVQTIAQRFTEARVLPALDTKFVGIPEKQGLWTEMCLGCGDCVLHLTGGVCPVARCSKNLLNGPCGGSNHGKCEVNGDTDCAWQLIYDRLAAAGRLDLMEREFPPKDWSKSRDGGPRRVLREDVLL